MNCTEKKQKIKTRRMLIQVKDAGRAYVGC